MLFLPVFCTFLLELLLFVFEVIYSDIITKEMLPTNWIVLLEGFFEA